MKLHGDYLSNISDFAEESDKDRIKVKMQNT